MFITSIIFINFQSKLTTIETEKFNYFQCSSHKLIEEETQTNLSIYSNRDTRNQSITCRRHLTNAGNPISVEIEESGRSYAKDTESDITVNLNAFNNTIKGFIFASDLLC